MIDESGGRDPAFPGIFQRAVRAGFIGILLVVLGGIPTVGPAQGSEIDPTAAGDTMLMFVGEDLGVLTIASRREESAWQAPAIAQVLTREELRSSGVRTLAGALDRTPGFHMAEKEWGDLPYLRGIPNGALVLYDTVPMVSDTSKSLNQLGHGTSLAPVKRIEIIRGPGSVLWGPDAFAGIVNVVPMTGRDLSGAETGFVYGEPDAVRGAYVNVGGAAGPWDGFFSATGRWEESGDETIDLVRFWADETAAYPFPERLGDTQAGEERFLEAFGRIGYGDWVTLTARVSEARTPYAITRSEGDLTWRESRRTPISFLKLETQWEIDSVSAVRMMGSHMWIDPELEVIDRAFAQHERTTYAEALYDRTVSAGSGLFTGGLAFRKKRIEGAPFWSGSLPTFLGPENALGAVPVILQEDYDTRLWSVFGQYSHKVGDFDLWGGLRYDAHDDYRSNVSHNLGVGWGPGEGWMVKLLYGTAYRTPYARQILEDDEPELENIQSYNLQVAWKPAAGTGLSVTGFYSRIDDHTLEDPYAGTEFSLPNTQRLYGVELSGEISPVDGLHLSADVTLIDNSGPDEQYHYNDYNFLRPDGTLVPHFTNREYPYDAGAETLADLFARWEVRKGLHLFGNLSYRSSVAVVDPRSGREADLKERWAIDIGLMLERIFGTRFDLTITADNLSAEDHRLPGTYTAIQGEEAAVEGVVRYEW